MLYEEKTAMLYLYPRIHCYPDRCSQLGRSEGKWNGGLPPYGCKLVNGYLIIEEDEMRNDDFAIVTRSR